MESSNIDEDLTPSGDREHGCSTSCVSNDEGGVLDAVLRNAGHLGHHASPVIIDGKSKI